MWSRRSNSVLVALFLALIITPALGACDRDAPTPDPGPTRVHLDPLATGEAGVPVVPVADVVPTWTLPPGAGRAVNVQPVVPPTTGPGGLAEQDPVGAPVGAIPEATARPIQSVDASGPPDADPEIERLAGLVQPARLASDVRRLVGFGTRHAESDTGSSSLGVGAAREWLYDGFAHLDGQGGRQVLVEFDDFELGRGGGKTTHRNVIATLPGLGRTKQVIYVVAHYDSRVADVSDATSDAPGADDNASGVAALLELGRVLSTRQWDATIRFVAFAAKETGLHGSAHHADAARRVGIPLLAVLNNDVVGSDRGPGGAADSSTVRVFSAGPDDSLSRGLARYVQHVGSRYGGPKVVVVGEPDRPGREGDHLSFSEAGFAAVRVVAGLEDPTRQHNGRDTADRLDAAYHAEIVRLNLAAVANLALAPPAPAEPALSTSPTQPDALRVNWDAVESDVTVAGYYVASRTLEQPTYDRIEWVGLATEHVIVGIDPGQTAVAVVSADDLGHTSLFSPEARP